MERLIIKPAGSQPDDPQISFEVSQGTLDYLIAASQEEGVEIGLGFWRYAPWFEWRWGFSWQTPYTKYHGHLTIWNIIDESG